MKILVQLRAFGPSIAAAGLVEAERYSALCARLPLAIEEKEHEDKEFAAMKQQVNALANIVESRARHRLK